MYGEGNGRDRLPLSQIPGSAPVLCPLIAECLAHSHFHEFGRELECTLFGAKPAGWYVLWYGNIFVILSALNPQHDLTFQ